MLPQALQLLHYHRIILIRITPHHHRIILMMITHHYLVRVLRVLVQVLQGRAPLPRGQGRSRQGRRSPVIQRAHKRR